MYNKARETAPHSTYKVLPDKLKKKLPKKSPTAKQKRFVKKLLEGHNKADAAKLAGYAHNANSALESPTVQRLLIKSLEKEGINDTLAAEKMKDGLNAMTPPKKDGGERYDDQFVRKQFLDMYFRLRGDYAPTEHNVTRKTINISITPEMAKGLEDAGAFDDDEEIIDARPTD